MAAVLGSDCLYPGGGGGVRFRQFDVQSRLEKHLLMAVVLGSDCLNPGAGGGGGLSIHSAVTFIC